MKVTFKTPYAYTASLGMHYVESLMSLTHQYPTTMKALVYTLGGVSLVCTSLVWSLPALGLSVPQGAAIAMTTIGAIGSVVSVASGVMQHHIFGFPAKNVQRFQAETYSLPDEKQAHGEMIIEKDCLPRLQIEAQDHFSAGQVEGYLLAKSIQACLKKMDLLYSVMRPLLRAPRHDSDLKPYLADVLKFIPETYQQEMRGKIKGYNQWLSEHEPTAKPLSFERYVLMHCLPDFLNYNPFSKYAPQVVPTFGCTTTLLRLKNYTFIIRVLDWPSYGMAGEYFLQLDRHIIGTRRTIDISNPLLSGGLTILNENGLFIEMNVSQSQRIMQPNGMPALFFNRYCAENAATVNEIEELLQKQQPLGPYHLTASDGERTETFHFYQNENTRGKHAYEVLGDDKAAPQIYVVANNGFRFNKENKPECDNHCDSNERKQNIQAYLNHEPVKQQLANAISMQEKSDNLSDADILSLKQLCLQAARLALVCNCESVMCGIFVYHHQQLVDASVLTDNLFAQKKELSQAQKVFLPTNKTGMFFKTADEKQESIGSSLSLVSGPYHSPQLL